MKIKDIPWWNRPGNKLKKKGVSSLDQAELLAIIFGIGNKEESAIDVSNRLLKKYSFLKLSRLSLTELKKEVDEIKALKIKSMFEIFRYTNKIQRKGFKPIIESAKDVYNYFVDFLKDKKKEYFYVLLLDSKNRIIKEELISVGTLNASLIHPREVFKEAIKNSANAIILVHNHPTGNPEPSERDKEVSEILFKAGELLNIKVLDHIIIGKDFYWSYKEKRIM